MRCSDQTLIKIRCVAVAFLFLISVIGSYIFYTVFWSNLHLPVSSPAAKIVNHDITVQDNRRRNNMASSFGALAETRKNVRNVTYVTRTDTHAFSIQAERIKHVLEVCKNEELLSKISYEKYKPDYYHSKRYNFSYCKVPKAGSTFWTQAFQIFDNDNKAVDIFKLDRQNVHLRYASQFAVHFDRKLLGQSRTILVARDPYSRLHSAFIDKSFLFIQPITNLKIRKMFPKVNNTYNSCQTEVTFQEFLDFIIFEAKADNELNKHWAPIVNLCRPCDVNAQILVKQESFSADVEYALRAFGIDNEKLDMLLAALHGNRIEDSVPGIIETLYDRINKNCIDMYTFTKRVWKSFQIQGFLKNELLFPDKEFHGIWEESQTMKNVVMDYIKKHPMTSQERKSQRNQALIDAYKSIKGETLNGIKKLYEVDFKMFGYDMNPPRV